MKQETTRALDLFITCVQGLIEADNLEPIYLQHIKNYVTSVCICEGLGAKSVQNPKLQPDFILMKETLNRIAEENGYPKLEDLDRRRVAKQDTVFPDLKIVR